MKITFLGLTISTANRLYRKLIEGKSKGWDKTEPHLFYYVMGVWDARIFGVCIYRNSKSI